jgi:hypothetical protein
MRADTAFLRCMLAPDFRAFNLAGALMHANDEIAGAARRGRPDNPLPPFPNAEVQVHGITGVVGGLTPFKRWCDIYVFEDGAWHAILSVDQPPPSKK